MFSFKFYISKGNSTMIGEIRIDSSQQNLKEVPSRILEMKHLKMLYLQQNFIKALPENFFEKLPVLSWLDLRENHLTTIPTSIAYHECLENLLVSDNKIEVLPNEVGLAPKLKVLQIANNPLKYPEGRIVAEGTKATVDYLRHQYEKMKPEPVEFIEEKTDTEEEEDADEEKELHMEKEMVVADYLEYVPRQESVESGLVVRGLSQVKKDDSGIIHKITNPTSNKILLKSYYDDEKVARASTQTDDSFTCMPMYKQTWMEKLKELLDQQEKILQQERNLQALTTWRSKKKDEPPHPAERNIYTKAPPYATDPQYQTILSREDLNKEIDKMVQHNKTPPKKPDIEKLISDLVSQLKDMEATYGALESPRSEIESAGAQITKIMEMHKKIMELQQANNLLLQ
ncbi:leucine-rich repeat-containing protein 27-like isoform X1 [Zophobas morio]|uniref:leucine-rich repeat-containing protein 27-like isoform X1 n=1 Tax=Zophobas morio TaxID=2755281 RepID=UPI0030834895